MATDVNHNVDPSQGLTPDPGLSGGGGSGGTMTAPPWHTEGPMPTISDSLFSLIILIYVGVIFVFMFFSFCWKEPDPPPPTSGSAKNIPMITEILLQEEKEAAKAAAALEAAKNGTKLPATAEEEEEEGADGEAREAEEGEAAAAATASSEAQRQEAQSALEAEKSKPGHTAEQPETEMKEMLLLDSLPSLSIKQTASGGVSGAEKKIVVSVVNETQTEPPKPKPPAKKADATTQVEGEVVAATQV